MAIRCLENDTHQESPWFQADATQLATREVLDHCHERELLLCRRPAARSQCSRDGSQFARHLPGSRGEPCVIRVTPLRAESGALSHQSAVAKFLCSSLPQRDL